MYKNQSFKKTQKFLSHKNKTTGNNTFEIKMSFRYNCLSIPIIKVKRTFSPNNNSNKNNNTI